ncbi:hypothetical protein [Hydrogenibacillus sp. N12]|uniref:hypothetical protein n=1 Tax=Hydrogenibacillus sp. N12 TaxID=2866627 RepID=UPI001C7DE63D|nr:hypothetical protein [Hydrogenibacillus sp. N12]QZA33210.1 hypothetical protein K2M58_01180 [Hydrogenibacillus sp. N12]
MIGMYGNNDVSKNRASFKKQLTDFARKDNEHKIFLLLLVDLLNHIEKGYYGREYSRFIKDLYRILSERERYNNFGEVMHEVNKKEEYNNMKEMVQNLRKYFPAPYYEYRDLIRRFAVIDQHGMGYRTIVSIQKEVLEELGLNRLLEELKKYINLTR